MKLFPLALSLVIALIVPVTAAEVLAAQDLLVRRDGSRSSGQLRSCVGESCNWNGSPVPRSDIAWIGLGAAGTPPMPHHPQVDAIWPKDGREISSSIVGISLGEVATETESVDRTDVVWIYFGSVTGLPKEPTPPLAAATPSRPVVDPSDKAATVSPSTDSEPTTVTPPAVQAAPAPRLLLNEILFLPQEKQAAFIEILNAGTASAVLEGVSIRNDKGKSFALPKGGELAAGALLVVRFDGAQIADKGAVHAPPSDLLGRTPGALSLSNREGTIDGVAWGVNQPRAVELCRGGRCSDPAPGSVIARLPDAPTAFKLAAWAPLDPELATPGHPNPRPPVSAIAGMPGMIFEGKPHFSWYSVAGAAKYLVQVARDEAFRDIVQAPSVDPESGVGLQQLTVEGAELPPGDYFWRVQALGAGGEGAEFSLPVPFSVKPSQRRDTQASVGVQAHLDSPLASRSRAEGDGPSAPSPAAPSSSGNVRVVLPVPVIRHQKDTRMLTLEAFNEKAPMGWDEPDTAGYPYCARAGVAMVNAYYRAKLHVPGKLSQDRLGYEAFKNLDPFGGPEYDLPVTGIADFRVRDFMLPFALGTRGKYWRNPGSDGPMSPPCVDYIEEQLRQECARQGWEFGSGECLDYRMAHEREIECPSEISSPWGYQMIANIRREIDAGHPVIATKPGHLFLIVGYAQQGAQFLIVYQDEGGREDIPIDATGLSGRIESYWTELEPVKVGSDEQSVIDDFDDDKVVDFDEEVRFETKVRERDSDGDGVNDKEEIHYSVWDPDHGYRKTLVDLTDSGWDSDAVAAANRAHREPMEISKESDNGGCDDGEEDMNANGIRDPGETSNFVLGDDLVAEDGTCRGLWTGTITGRHVETLDDGTVHVWSCEAEARLREWILPLKETGPSGRRIGRIIRLVPQGSVMHNRSSCSGPYIAHCGGEGSTVLDYELDEVPQGSALYLKDVDVDTTSLLKFDVPREGGLYFLAIAAPTSTTFPWTITSTDGQSTTWEHGYTCFQQGNVPILDENMDPQRRSLEGGRMVGSYTSFWSGGTLDVSWSLCRHGTQCAALPPLPPMPPTPPTPESAVTPP